MSCWTSGVVYQHWFAGDMMVHTVLELYFTEVWCYICAIPLFHGVLLECSFRKVGLIFTLKCSVWTFVHLTDVQFGLLYTGLSGLVFGLRQ